MTEVAVKLLHDFKQLAPDEQLIIRDQVISLTQSRQVEALNRLCGSTAGMGLLGKLLASRAEERDCG